MEERLVVLAITEEEALELLHRCLANADEDTEAFRSALAKLARTVARADPGESRCCA